MPPPAHPVQAGDLNDIWIRCDDEDILREARTIIEYFRQVRTLGEAMIRGAIRRQAITLKRGDDELTG